MLFIFKFTSKPILQDNHSPEIKYGASKAALKHLKHTFGQGVLEHFDTDDALQAGMAATQVGVILAHVRRIIKSKGKLEAAIEILSEELKHDFRALFAMCNGSTSSSSSSKPRVLKASLSEVSVDSIGFPKVPTSPASVKLDTLGFPLTPSPAKALLHSSPMAPHKCFGHPDDDALACSPPPVDKKTWHAEKKPAAAPAMLHVPVAPAAPKGSKSVATQKVGGTGDFVINSGTVKVGGGKDQTYLQHRPNPKAGLQLICSVTSKMVAGSHVSHSHLINKLLPAAKKPGATKNQVVAARDKLLQTV